MDLIRFPFIKKYEEAVKQRRLARKEGTKLKKRIKKLVHENEHKFFDPVRGVEVHPSRKCK